MADLHVHADQIKILQELVRLGWKDLAANPRPYVERRAAIKEVLHFSTELRRQYFKTGRYSATSPEAMCYFLNLAKLIQSMSGRGKQR